MSKVERNRIRFTGRDIKRYENEKRVKIKDGVKSMEKIMEIKKVMIIMICSQS